VRIIIFLGLKFNFFMVEEICQPIPGYEEHYVITRLGAVHGVERLIKLVDGTNRTVRARQISSRPNQGGYETVRLSKEGITKTHFVHRLVATTYIPNPDGLPIINHKTGNIKDNSVENLEWSTMSLNTKHAYNIGLNSNCGSNHKLAVQVVDHNCGLKFKTIREFANFYGMNYSTARNVLNGQIALPKQYVILLDLVFKNVA
jgi:hypothetical protein